MSDEPDDQAARADEVDSLRIRQLATLRRATYRSRSHAIIAAAVCAGVAVQLGWVILLRVRWAGWGWRPMVFAVLLLACLAGAIWFTRRAAEFHRAAQQATGEEPAVQPDFSTLSDGSQRARNLEEIE